VAKQAGISLEANLTVHQDWQLLTIAMKQQVRMPELKTTGKSTAPDCGNQNVTMNSSYPSRSITSTYIWKKNA